MPDRTRTDPLGRAIVLHDRTWHGHVLVRHPEMAALRVLVENAIGTPITIVFSLQDANARLYYGRGPTSNLMVQVIVDVALGLVKTAHLAKRITGGGVEWSSTP